MTDNVSLTRLKATVTRLHRLLRRGPQRLTPAQDTLLAQLHRSGPQTVGQLAEHQDVSNATISRMLATLERKAMVRRARDKRDRRVVYVIATREGVAQWSQDSEASQIASLLANLSDEQARLINQALDLLDREVTRVPTTQK